MTLYTEIQEELRNTFSLDGKYIYRRWKNSTNSSLKLRIEELDIPGFVQFEEKIWALWNNNFTRPKCSVCNKNTHFKGFEVGFLKTCSVKCASNSIETKTKIRDTLNDRYGGHHMNSEKTKDKFRVVAMEKYNGKWPGSFGTDSHKNAIKGKYGVDHIFQAEIIKEKIMDSFQNQYGVNSPQQVSEIRERTKNTQLSRYGQDGFNPKQNKKTMQERYGVDYALQSKEIKEKIRMTCIRKYGVSNVMQNQTIFEGIMQAQQDAKYKFKSMILPSGKEIFFQGFEGEVINYLLLNKIEEGDLKNNRVDIPTIPYFFKGKKRLYFPDIFIKSKNMIIEVKSSYAFDCEMEMNLAKQVACKNLGYHHIIIIWDSIYNNIVQII